MAYILQIKKIGIDFMCNLILANTSIRFIIFICLLVLPSVAYISAAPLDEFPSNLILETFMNTC